MRQKRVFRDWQHPRDDAGRFSRTGGASWMKRARERFSDADTSTTGPGGRSRFGRAAKAEALIRAHERHAAPQRTMGAPGTGRDITAMVDAEMRADYDPGETFFRNGRTSFDDPRSGDFRDPRDYRLTRLVRAQGWGTPGTGSRAEVDARIADGWAEAFRGVRPHGDSTAEGQIEAMRDSPDFEYGSGIYGNGIYFSADRRVADTFSRADPDSPKHTTDQGAVVRVAISPHARVVDHDALLAEKAAWLKANGRGVLADGTLDLVLDEGRFAAMMGYDVIVVRNKQDGHWNVGVNAKGRKVKTRSKATQYVVLNRGAMIVEEV